MSFILLLIVKWYLSARAASWVTHGMSPWRAKTLLFDFIAFMVTFITLSALEAVLRA